MRAQLLFIALCIVATLALQVNHKQSNNAKVDADHDSIDKLFEIKQLLDAGVLTPEEYEKVRAHLVQSLMSEPEIAPQYQPYSDQVKFLLNRLVDGVPRSYQDILPTPAQDNYWLTPVYLEVGGFDYTGKKLPLDDQISIQERALTHFGLNLYDGATWEIGLALAGLHEVASSYEKNVLYPGSTGSNDEIGGLADIRADNSGYKYGMTGIGGDDLQQVELPGNVSRVIVVNGVPSTQTSKLQAGAFYYRMIGPKYSMQDPITGDYANAFKYPYPDNDTTTPWNIAGEIHWNDWKPITGENVWAAIIGPLQVLMIRNGSNMPNFLTFDDTPSEVQLAISILPALVALQSPLGALYHCPKGTKMFPPDPNEETNVSNENNFSAYAALTMLHQLLEAKTVGTSDPVLMQAKNDVTNLLQGLDKWIDQYILSDVFNGTRVIYQGGHVSFRGVYDPVPIDTIGGFAVDCQTWGMTVLGVNRIDSHYGAGTAYNIWQATKKFAGYYSPDGQLGGVGYTINPNSSEAHTIWSAEWSWGAINMCETLAAQYQATNPAYAASLTADANSMIAEIQKPIVRCASTEWCGGGLVQEDGSYLYANQRFFIPWGWYANPIGATCSTAWAVMHEMKFNPFVLGGNTTSPFPTTYRQ